MIIHRPFVGEKKFSYALGLYSDGWAGCSSTDLGEGARQNGFFGNQVRDVKWRVDENQGSDRSEHSL